MKTIPIFRDLTIRNRLILTYSLLVMLCVGILSSFSYSYSAKIITEKTGEHVHRILQQSSQNMDKSLREIEEIVNTFTSVHEVFNVVQYGRSSFMRETEHFNIYDTLTNIQLYKREIQSIHIFSYNGRTYGNQLHPDPEEALKQLKPIAEEANGRFVWLDADEKQGVVSAVKAIRNSSLENIGVLLVNIHRSSLEGLFSWQKSEASGDVIVMNERGKFITSTGENIDKTMFDNKLTGEILSVKDKFREIHTRFNRKDLLIYVYNSSYNNWKYVSIIPVKAMVRDVESIKYLSIVWGLLFTVIFVGITVVIAFGITVPIKRITRSMSEFKLKGVAAPVRLTNNDELSYLYETFKEMTGRINSLIETVYEQEILKREQQLKILQSQINPHFLYNTFDIINWMARKNNVPEIGSVIKALSNVMRYTITVKDSEVTLEQEMRHVEDYLKIQ